MDYEVGVVDEKNMEVIGVGMLSKGGQVLFCSFSAVIAVAEISGKVVVNSEVMF